MGACVGPIYRRVRTIRTMGFEPAVVSVEFAMHVGIGVREVRERACSADAAGHRQCAQTPDRDIRLDAPHHR